MAKLDLNPTSDETIEKLGLTLADLWNIRLGDEIFGPFETESLKHFASENQDKFENALISRAHEEDYKPFFSLPIFQRRGPQVLSSVDGQKNEFWILLDGQKAGPLNRNEIDKRIELGTMSMVDLVSLDHGHTWYKLYQIDGFDRRFHSSSELPFAPPEAHLGRSEVELLEAVEEHSHLSRPSDELAAMAYDSHAQAKILSFKTEDAVKATVEESVITGSLKWQLPLAMGMMLLAVMGIFHVSSNIGSGDSEFAATEEAEKSETILPPTMTPNPSHQLQNRFPASQNPDEIAHRRFPAPPVVHHNPGPNDLPTQIDTHHDPVDDDPNRMINDEREPASEYPTHVDTNQEPQNLDAAMGNPQPEAQQEHTDY